MASTAPALYTFDYREVLRWIAAQPDDTDSLALVGHNPAFTELVNFLVGPGTLDNLPTAGWAELSIRIDEWCRPPMGRASSFITLFPKSLAQSDGGH